MAPSGIDYSSRMLHGSQASTELSLTRLRAPVRTSPERLLGRTMLYDGNVYRINPPLLLGAIRACRAFMQTRGEAP